VTSHRRTWLVRQGADRANVSSMLSPMAAPTARLAPALKAFVAAQRMFCLATVANGDPRRRRAVAFKPTTHANFDNQQYLKQMEGLPRSQPTRYFGRLLIAAFTVIVAKTAWLQSV
jgi:hypothetical protein